MEPSIEQMNIALAEFEGAIYSPLAEAWGFGDAREDQIERGNKMIDVVWAREWIAELDYHTNWNSLHRILRKMGEIPFNDLHMNPPDSPIRQWFDKHRYDVSLESDILEVHEYAYQFTQFIKTQQQ